MYPNYKSEKELYYFEYAETSICYDSNEKKFYVDKELFSKIPHILPDGSLCLHGNNIIKLKELDEEILLKNTLETYIPWLLTIPPELKTVEFINEIDFYLRKLYHTKIKKLKNINHVYKTIQVLNPLDLWETIENLKLNKIYEIYPNKYPEYKVYIKKTVNEFIINYDLFNKSRLRILGEKISDIKEKICFIGVGSVNSYIIKQCLARNITEMTLVDDDKFKIDNAFRFAFPYKSKSKIDCVKEFVKILNKPVSIDGYSLKINAESSKKYLDGCKTVFISVDNLYSWLEVAIYLQKNADAETKIFFVGIDAFGGYGKFILSSVATIQEDMRSFLFYNDGSQRRMMLGNGCGKSLAVYDEEDLTKLANAVINYSGETRRVEKVEFKN